jgi:adenine-specific DNA glycosylase
VRCADSNALPVLIRCRQPVHHAASAAVTDPVWPLDDGLPEVDGAALADGLVDVGMLVAWLDDASCCACPLSQLMPPRANTTPMIKTTITTDRRNDCLWRPSGTRPS